MISHDSSDRRRDKGQDGLGGSRNDRFAFPSREGAREVDESLSQEAATQRLITAAVYIARELGNSTDWSGIEQGPLSQLIERFQRRGAGRDQVLSSKEGEKKWGIDCDFAADLLAAVQIFSTNRSPRFAELTRSTLLAGLVLSISTRLDATAIRSLMSGASQDPAQVRHTLRQLSRLISQAHPPSDYLNQLLPTLDKVAELLP